jgi:carboxyl-terminal processing protease
MGKLHIVPALCLFVFASFCAAEPQLPSIAQSLSSTEKRQLEREARLVVDLVQNYHESGRLFREIDNREILTRFLKEVDPQSRFFNADDVEFIQQRFGRTLKSVYLLKGDLQPAFEIFDLFNQRVLERTNWIEQRLKRGFDFSVDETFIAAETDSSPVAQTPAAADLRWEQQLKDEILSEIVAGRTEDEAVAEVAKNYAKLRRHVATLDSLAVREHFFDGLLRSFDPHSGYFSADSAKEFAIEMNGTIAGAGLELSKENGLCTVTAVTPGGPADLNTDIRPGDLIDAFSEGEATWTDTKEKRLREVVALIRGKAGSKLRLAFHHANEAQRHEVTIERSVVVSIADRARGTLCTVPAAGEGKRRIGWIDLPMFYATRDVCKLISKMKKDGADGLVLDLRNNGGGALPEALALSGLFIPKGLVMLSRGLDGKIVEHQATETPDLYPGPLVILISARSASASEIFTGAMKFHHRAIVVGSPATFGKGSVQNYIELAKTTRNPAGDVKDWGTLRLTAQRFYLPDGKAMQRNGVTSDIVLPLLDSPDFLREEKQPHALLAEPVAAPASAIPNTSIQNVVTDSLRLKLQQQAADDINNLPEWSLWQQEQEYINSLTSTKTRSLLLEARQHEWQQIKTKLASLRGLRRELQNKLAFSMVPVELDAVQTAIDAHRSRLAMRIAGDNATQLNHLHSGGFIIKTTQGHLRQLWLDQIDFRRFSGDAETLAAAFTAGASSPATAAELESTFQLLALLEHKTDEAVLGCFSSRVSAAKIDLLALQKGVDAVLLRMTELDGDLRQTRPSLDVPLREALRIASDWTDEIQSIPATTAHTP